MATSGIRTYTKKLLRGPQSRVPVDTTEEPLDKEEDAGGVPAFQTDHRATGRQAVGKAREERFTSLERRLSDRLGVFFDGWTLEAAVTICGGEDISEQELTSLLARLVDAGQMDRKEENGGVRYRFAEEQEARRRFEATAEADTMRRRHRDYFLQWARQADLARRSAEDTSDARKAVPEYANLWAAILWSQQQKEIEMTLRLAQALARLCPVRQPGD